MGSATATKRGSKLTPELQQQLTAYFPLVKKMAFDARFKYRKAMPDFTLDDWTSHLTEAACRIAPCWDPGKGVFGTLLKVGLSNIIKNVIRDYMKPDRNRIRGRQQNENELDEQAGLGDVLEEIVSRADFDEAHDLLDEIRSDLRKATKFTNRLALVRDFLRGCNAEWIHRRPSVEIASLLGVTPAIVMRARGLTVKDSEPSPETAPSAPKAANLPQVEDQVAIKEMPASVPPAIMPVPASVPTKHRQRFGLRVRSRRWLVASFC